MEAGRGGNEARKEALLVISKVNGEEEDREDEEEENSPAGMTWYTQGTTCLPTRLAARHSTVP